MAGEVLRVCLRELGGLVGARIVLKQSVGAVVGRGGRLGRIKFCWRVDVLLAASATAQIKVGDRVKGGSSVLAYLDRASEPLAPVEAEATRQGAR